MLSILQLPSGPYVRAHGPLPASAACLVVSASVALSRFTVRHTQHIQSTFRVSSL
jgi:hypothetical protein